MSRPKTYTDSDLISIVIEYIETEGHGETNKIKWSKLASFSERSGKSIQEHVFRKKPAVQSYIHSLKDASVPKNLDTFMEPYKPLDKNAIWEHFSGYECFMHELDSIDAKMKYYYDTASSEHAKVLSLTGGLAAQKCRIEELEAQLDAQKQVPLLNNAEIVRLKQENELLRYTIRKHLRPEIARVLCSCELGKAPSSDVLNKDSIDELAGKEIISVADVRTKVDAVFQGSQDAPVTENTTKPTEAPVVQDASGEDPEVDDEFGDNFSAAVERIGNMSRARRRRMYDALNNKE